jgi:hypothetical protein
LPRSWRSAATSTSRVTLGINLIPVDVRDASGLDAAFQVLEHARVGLVFVLPDPLFVTERRRIAALAIEAHLPTLFAFREHVQKVVCSVMELMFPRASGAWLALWTKS